MDPFQYGKALAELWTMGGNAWLSGQDAARKAFEEMARATSFPAPGALPGLTELGSVGEDIAKANQALMELWNSAASLSGTLAQAAPASDPDSAVAASFRRMTDPRLWLTGMGETDAMLQSLAEGPRLADLWSVERKYAKLFQVWGEMRRATLEHTNVVLSGWMRAAQRFSEEVGKLPGGMQAPRSSKDLLSLWTETANAVLLETQRSEAFLRTQAEAVRASARLRLAQRELTEHYGELFDLPTRTELDDVHRTVTELRRELRALQRQQREAAAAPRPAPVSDIAAEPVAIPAATTAERSTPSKPVSTRRPRRGEEQRHGKH